MPGVRDRRRQCVTEHGARLHERDPVLPKVADLLHRVRFESHPRSIPGKPAAGAFRLLADTPMGANAWPDRPSAPAPGRRRILAGDGSRGGAGSGEDRMKTLEIEVPDQLARQIEELVRGGWFTDENELARQALGDFLRHHRLDLQEQHQLDDIAWARRLK